ncbi:indole-3-glycerol phosphate synthase TrpC [Flavobacterium agricola]|uniref:indole-3-glycerol-phosphate synthase n=1 Tax=Flavobacterium agricola TaxID=2870839 RepID=A0ABY6M1B2_9FLAO|nr:indole-3-glycerol phosphate synthase TrpC [Flavobacterium agricola]UYW01602.1 indole-3-glycerol phosphate synthase TrpC [Flavobacterium agricola]
MSVNILNQIVQHKKLEVQALQNVLPIALLEQQIAQKINQNKSLIQSITNSDNGIISEFKRRSPSKKEINYQDSILKVAAVYQQNKSAGMSVLTDTPFFGGSLTDLAQAQTVYHNPILRKDFIVNEYQVYQAKAYGAHAILLIAACLSKSEMQQFSALAKQLNLEVLVEIHDADELTKIPFDAHILYGINNRNLKSFAVDFHNSIKLSQQLPQDSIKIAESGITSAQNILVLREKGFSGFLIGELLMRMDFDSDQITQFFNAVKK